MPWTVGLAVRVFTHERAHAGRRRVVEALVALAQEQRLAGVTVTRALAEAPSPDAPGGDGPPLIVEMVDRAERIEAVLPQIAALIPQGALSVTETRIYLPASRLRASDAREQPEQTLPPDAPAAEALHALLNHGVRLIPVLDATRKPLGVLTINHLLRQIKDELTERPLDLSQPAELRERLLAQLDGKRARDLMRSPALGVSDDAPLDSVARYLTSHHITRALTLDGEGRCTGIVSEHTLARLMTRSLLLSDADALALAPGHAETRAALAGSVEPTGGERLLAGMLADRRAPTLAETATWDEVTLAMEAADSGGVALVVDARGLLRGVIEEGALLERATGATHERGLTTLRRLLAQATGQREAPDQLQTLRAGALSQPARLIEAPDTPLALALAHMVTAGAVDYAVIAAPDTPPDGVLWRQDALRALVGG